MTEPTDIAGATGTSPVERVAPGVFRVRDTCNVYVIVSDAGEGGRTGVCIDFGSGLVLDHLGELGLDSITDVLMTHHHRDQGQGLPRAVAAGIRIHVPPVEVDLFADVETMWQTRPIPNDYNLRQDRFSLLESVPVTSVVPEYRTADYGGVSLRVIPTPGHTTGSVTYLLEREGETVAFTGDLIYAPGKVWSLAATQWTYSNHEGPAMTVLSCYLLLDENPTLLLPSHGQPMGHPEDALFRLVENMQTYVDSRRERPWDLHARLRFPYISITEHLLLNRSSLSCSYVLLSATGEALFVDFGYDMITGLPGGTDRASRRPWLASLPGLKKEFGVTRVSVALPTHYHDDHVAGMTLLQEVEGTEIWSPENVAPILDDPLKHDLPCQWFDPIRSDRVLPLGESFTWNEYVITPHAQPGHTLYAVAYEVEVDGVTVVFTGDQQVGMGVPGEVREFLNYQYRNLFRIEDYVRSAELYRRVAPGLMVSGHWQPRWVDDGYLDHLAEEGRLLADIHRQLLPLDELDMAADSMLVRVTPYRSVVPGGSSIAYTATVKNPHPHAATATLTPVLPSGWRAEPAVISQLLEVGQESSVGFTVMTDDTVVRHARVAIDVTIGALALGQHVEALVDVE
jgi:glyoxylase-like metal-dependent hydrolase (beta-lactamase superfamily II)